jgi:hypothetical protein
MTDFFWKSIPSMLLLLLTTSQIFVYILGTWSYLRICRRSVLPYTRFCNCLLITITLYTLLTSLFCIHQQTKGLIIQARTYCDTNLTISPPSKKWSPWQIFLKINPIHPYTITDNVPKFHVYPSTSVGVIQATIHIMTHGLTGQKHYTHSTSLRGV